MKKYFKGLGVFLMMFFLSGCSGLGSPAMIGTSTVATSSVMKTADGGKKWEAKSNPGEKISLNAVDVLSLAINPFDGKNIFVGTLKNGIVKTDDGGEKWNFLDFPAEKVYAILIDHTQSQVMYATGLWQGRGKIFKTIDHGKEWKEVYTASSEGPLVISLAMDRVNAGVLYAGTTDNQIIKSVDGGASWQSLFSAPGPVSRISIDSADPNLIYLLVHRGDVMRSDDGGKTFVTISTEIRSGLEVLVTDPVTSKTVYVAGVRGIFKSKDAGSAWEEIKTLGGASEFVVTALAVNPSNSNEVFYGMGQAIYKSVDGGKNWSPVQLETQKTVSVISYDAASPSNIYLGLKKR